MAVKYRTDLTAEFVRRVLDYDPQTGELKWRARPEYPQKWNSKWAGKVAGTTAPQGYRYIQVFGRSAYPAHRLAWLHFYGEWPEHEIDHANGVRDDNRIGNLRCADDSENGSNKAMMRNNRSGFPGVHFDRQRGKWRATIQMHRVRHDVGFFSTAEQAAAARNHFAKRIQKEFVPSNPGRPRYFHSRDARKKDG